MRCPKCQLDNPDAAAFCENCASPLAAEPETVAYETQTLPPPDRDFTPGTVIAGRYKLREELGRGGMGSVFRAEQITPIHRDVALKIIRLGMDTARVVARFEAERQALAVMDHPNIATVLDAGATEKGRPFFVMELVHGIPIDDYCDKHKLKIRERMELFICVCHAVQHAHQKGIIHRDLKPSNILVMVQDGRPVPKVIDFGIAKATAHRLTERTLFTEQGQLIGTPEYMSPEQAEMTGLDVDTRTDIYSLGVMLYGLLVGKLPFEPMTLRSAGLAEIQRIIRDTDPPRPSTRVSTLGAEGRTVAEKMRTEFSVLRKELKGDLDWIIMKSMEKDRTRRYATASELAADIERHMRHEPVTAGPPSQIYRIGKYVKRHRLGVAAASIVTLAIIAGIIGTSIGLVKATRSEKKAREEAQTAQQVSEFLVNLFKVSDPGEARGNTITAREILETGAEKIEKELAGQPLIQSRLMETIGQVYQSLGLFGLAEPLLKKTLEIRRAEAGEDHYYTGVSMINLAWFYLSQRRTGEAEPLVRDGVAILEEAPVEREGDLARGLLMRGMILRDRGEFDPAQELMERSLELNERTFGPEHERSSYPLYHLGWLHKLKAEYAKAEEYYERALTIMEKGLGSDHPTVLWCLNDLAVVADNKGDYGRAKELFTRVLAAAEKVLGPGHPFMTAPLNNLGVLHWRQGEYVAAEASYLRALDIAEKTYGPDSNNVVHPLQNLAMIYRGTGEFEKARRFLERALAISEKTEGPESPGAADKLRGLAVLAYHSGHVAEALPLFEKALALKEKFLEPDHPSITGLLVDYGGALRKTGDFAKAKAVLERIVSAHGNALGPDNSWAAIGLMNLAKVFAAQGETENAARYYGRAMEAFEKSVGLEALGSHFSRACYWAVAGDRDAALTHLKRALELGHKGLFYHDPDFAALKGDKEFEALAAESMTRTGLGR